MTTEMTPSEFIALSARYPVIDVRSPGEHSRGHIPQASNVPLLDDAERAQVGITYKNCGREPAVSLGLEIVRPKIPQLVAAVRSISPTPDVLVHCWRGGMRSAGFAELLQTSGFRPRTLRGGYKAFRRVVHRSFAEPRRIVILSGLTGCGKTHLLKMLRSRGEQIIDLEGLARHRGSAFGGIGQPAQPTVEQFENELFREWDRLDPARVVWIESESQAVGRVLVPQPVWQQMLDAPAIFLEVGRAERLDWLLTEYGTFPADELRSAIERIKKRLGGERLNRALAALSSGDLAALADIVLDYYDKAYQRASECSPWSRMTPIAISHPTRSDPCGELQRLAEAVSRPSLSQ